MTKYLFIIAAYFAFACVQVWSQNCLQQAMPIGEKDLLEIKNKYARFTEIEDEAKDTILTAFGYADSTGAIEPVDILAEIFRCTIPWEQGADTVLLYYVKGKAGYKDETVYEAIKRGDRFVAHTLIAQLQTTCEETYLRGCSLNEDGSVSIQQLKHMFVCGTDEYKGREDLPSFGIRLRDDHTFEDVFE